MSEKFARYLHKSRSLRRENSSHRARVVLAATFAGVVALSLAACGSSSASRSSNPSANTAGATQAPSDAPTTSASTSGNGQKITVNAAAFPEGQLMAHVLADALDAAGFEASIVQTQGREVSMPALSKGDLDVSPEYSSSALDYFKAGTSTSNDAENLANLKKYAGQKGINVLAEAPATDNYAFGVATAFANAHNLKSLSDLAAYSQTNPITVAGIQQCEDRSYCLAGLKSLYGLKVNAFKVIVLSSQQSVDQLLNNKVQLVQFDSSDGVLAANPVTILQDDKGLNHADHLVPLVNAKADSPALDNVLNAIMPRLTQDLLNEANQQVQVERVPVAKAAQDLYAKLS